LFGDITSRDTSVAVLYADMSGVVVVQLYYCPFLPHSSMVNHPMPSSSFEIAVALGFYFFCNLVSSNNQL